MHPTTWKASGHVDAFNDPLIDNKDSKKRYRADNLIEEFIDKIQNKLNKEVFKNEKRIGKMPSGFLTSIRTAEAAINIPPNSAIQSPEF